MSALVRAKLTAPLLALVLLASSALASDLLFEAKTPDGALAVGYGPGWSVLAGDDRSFYIVKASADVVRVEKLVTEEGDAQQIASRMENDLKAAGATVTLKPFQTAAASGYQIEGEIERLGAKYHLLQTIVGEGQNHYLITVAMPPERFRASEPDLQAILQSLVVGEIKQRPKEPEKTELEPPLLKQEQPEKAAPPASPSRPSPAPAPKVPGWLGVKIVTVTDKVAKDIGARRAEGVLVVEVIPASPAEKAGLKTGDILLRFDRKSLYTSESVTVLVAQTHAGQRVVIDLIRGGKGQSLPVMIEEQKPQAAAPPKPEAPGWLGLMIQAVTPEKAAQLGLETTAGALVVGFPPESPAQQAGVAAGDIIVAFGDQPIDSPARLVKLSAATKPGESVALTVLRNSRQVTLNVVIGKSPAPEPGR